MRASELVGKEVIDIVTGERLGTIQKSELMVNLENGMVENLIFIEYGWGGREKKVRSISWQEIRKISEELVIIAADPAEMKQA